MNDSTSIRQVFAPGLRLDRPEPLLVFHNYGSENMVSTVDGELHLERRKLVRSFYSARNIESEAVQNIANKCVDSLENLIDEEMRSHGTANLFLLFRYLGCDFMSRFVYGEKYGLNLLSDSQLRKEFERDLSWQEEGLLNLFTFWFAHSLTTLRNLGLISKNTTPDGVVTGRPGRARLRDRKAESSDDKLNTSSTSNTLFDQLASTFESKSPSRVMPDEKYVLSEGLDHFWAGVETTARTLSSIIFRLSHPDNKHQQDRLRQELQKALNMSGSSYSYTAAKSVSYLECVIREGLRLDPPFKDSVTREAPKDHQLVLHGYHIPPGIAIGAQAYSVHRNHDVFSEPEDWKPERWDIPQNLEEYTKMKRHIFAFGAGPRMCIGMNVAWNQLHLVLGRIYLKYETSLSADFLSKHGAEVQEWPEKGVHPVIFTKTEEMKES